MRDDPTYRGQGEKDGEGGLAEVEVQAGGRERRAARSRIIGKARKPESRTASSRSREYRVTLQKAPEMLEAPGTIGTVLEALWSP